MTWTASTTWPAPGNMIPGSLAVDAWGESGNAAAGISGVHGGAGSGGGAYAGEPSLGGVIPGITVLTIIIGSGGTGTATTVTGASVTVTANFGTSAVTTTAGVGGAAGSNTKAHAGGPGGAGAVGIRGGSGGGGSGGSTGAGGTGNSTGTGAGGLGGAAGTGTPPGAAGAQGGSGGAGLAPGVDGTVPGGGASGGSGDAAGTEPGGLGASGQVIFTWSEYPNTFAGLATGTGGMPGTPAVSGSFKGIASGVGGPVPAQVVNAWSGTFAQPAAFGITPPALQSTVITLDAATSVGGGSGTPTQGNWLFLIAGWNQDGLPAATVGDADDIHSFWRPGDVETSTWAVSPSTGSTRASVWYTPNLARVPGTTYTAPNGIMAGMACLVLEAAGIGPWDVVTGIYTAYAAAASSLTLALPAPSSQTFAVAAVCGDDDSASQAFAPAGWTALPTVTATNGSDHTCDAVLTSACITTSGSVSVSATATSSDLSGVIIAVQTGAPSPIPAGHNPNWPYVIFEAAFGGGFQTPADELTWTDLSGRLWSWDETTGVQYQLGDLQATNLDLELDNFDNALASDNTGSPYYSTAINQNMSFADSIAPWTATGSSTPAWSSAQAYSSSPGAVATHSLRVTPSGTAANPGAASEMIPVDGSTAYSPSAWFYSAGGYGSGAVVTVTWYTSLAVLISSAASPPVAMPGGAWTQVQLLDQTSPSNAAFAVITVQFAGTAPAIPFWVAEAALAPGAAVVATGLVTTGVPVRIRAAIGTIGGVTVDRWYIIQRNAEEWPQMVDEAYRRNVAATATDIWSTTSNPEPTPYRGEVQQDKPYAWWPMDDPPGLGGVLPSILRNAAEGNSNPLNILLSPNGGTKQFFYTDSGISTSNYAAPSIPVYAVAADQGWMPGDPQASQAAYATTNPVTAIPGAAAWQASGQAGTTGSYGWFLSCHDTRFPSLSTGVTLEKWFSYPFFAGSAGLDDGSHADAPICQQPQCALTIMEITTASLPVAIIQLDTSGHLQLITYHGATPTSHAIYTASDLRSNSWHHVAAVLTATTWTVYVDGGLTATVSGSATGMTPGWEWLVVNADMAANGGGTTSAIVHGGNMSASHLAVYPWLLPPWRIWAHYCAAALGFGCLAVPSGTAIQWISTGFGAGTSSNWAPDGSTASGTYNAYNGVSASALVTASAGTITSGPSAWTSGVAFQPSAAPDATLWVQWAGLAPAYQVYTSQNTGAETDAATICGSGASFTAGYGAGATGAGTGQTAGGTGASPPAAGTAAGDTVSQRIERCLGYGLVTYPGRCIDPAPLLVQAATDMGGQATAVNVFNQVDSDGGLYFIDNLANQTYWSRPHLAAQFTNPVWEIGPDTAAGQDPYYREIKWTPDPQRIWNAVAITPFAPDESTLPLIVPQQAALVLASQAKFGAQPKQITSYLQSQAEMQLQADSLFANFGSLHVRAENVKLDAAPDPSLWVLTLGINIGDISTAEMWQIGAGGTTWTFRVSEIKRRIVFREGETTASVTLKLDAEPTYWS